MQLLAGQQYMQHQRLPSAKHRWVDMQQLGIDTLPRLNASTHVDGMSLYPGDPNMDVQGPPGTGKTSAIIGMVSALLARNAEVAVQQQEQPASKPRAVSREGDGNRGSPDRDSSEPAARVLVCAQSNAAIDELIARLATPGLITPGKPAPASFKSTLTALVTLLHARCKTQRPLPTHPV